jgi:Ser/Thr protein kinase RdoA (MazF antagonist)
LPVSNILRTAGSQHYAVFGDALVELEEYVAHDAKMDSWARIEEALPLLGRAHTALRTLSGNPAADLPPTANHVASEEVATWLGRAAAKLASWKQTPEQTLFLERARELGAHLTGLEPRYAGSLPRQVVHGDFWDNNVLFKEGRVVLVTDLDFMGYRPRIDDLALTLYYTNATYADDRLETGRRKKLASLVHAYDSGLAQPLSKLEREAIPLALARTPLFMLRHITNMSDQAQAVRPIQETLIDLEWATRLVYDIPSWQQAFSASAAG